MTVVTVVTLVTVVTVVTAVTQNNYDGDKNLALHKNFKLKKKKFVGVKKLGWENSFLVKTVCFHYCHYCHYGHYCHYRHYYHVGM